MLSFDIVKLTIISGLVAIPIACMAVEQWLEDYAYQMPVDVGLFAWPVVLITMLVLFTISMQTITAANRDPVKTIRYE